MRKALILAGILLAVTCVYASPSGIPDYTNPETISLLSFSSGGWQTGYPYTAAITGINGPVKVMCDDYAHGGVVGQSWTANITDLGSNNLFLTRFGHMESALGAAYYREAGWILLQTLVMPQSEYEDMNYAVWHIFDSAAPLDSGAQAWLNAARAEAAMGFPGVDFNKVFIITPVDQYDPNPNDPQEFLTIDPRLGSSGSTLGATPEPGTWLLLGTGLLGLWTRKWLH
jgi:hypothetical protein